MAQDSGNPPTTRLAPSPTGALHLGNARTFLITWALARSLGWRLVFRLEDLDTPRVKPGAAGDIASVFRRLQIDWDPPVVGPSDNPLVQSRDLTPYLDAMRLLARRGLAYPCALSRAQIEAAASAPQDGSHDVPYPASLRPPLAGQPLDFDGANERWASEHAEPANWRFLTPSGSVAFTDAFLGPLAFDPAASIGDFVLWTKRGQPSYQLAVVVDDHRQGVTQVVRADDLAESAARQLLLYRALGLSSVAPGEPTYTHLPLVVGMDGRRLAKRHGDTRIDRYEALGVPMEAIIGLIAHWSIPGRDRLPTTAEEFRLALVLNSIPARPVPFTPEDDRWLLSNAR